MNTSPVGTIVSLFLIFAFKTFRRRILSIKIMLAQRLAKYSPRKPRSKYFCIRTWNRVPCSFLNTLLNSINNLFSDTCGRCFSNHFLYTAWWVNLCTASSTEPTVCRRVWGIGGHKVNPVSVPRDNWSQMFHSYVGSRWQDHIWEMVFEVGVVLVAAVVVDVVVAAAVFAVVAVVVVVVAVVEGLLLFLEGWATRRFGRRAEGELLL